MHVRRPSADPQEALHASRRAARRVLARYAGGVVAVSDHGHVEEQLEDLLAALEGVLTQGRVGDIPRGSLDRLQLLRALRSEILRTWTGEGDGLLELMLALEEVQDELPEARHDAAIGASLTPFARELLHEVAHLLRSPLGSIVMLTDMLRDEVLGPLTDAQARQVDIIHRAALGITHTAEDLLTLADERERTDRSETFSVTDLLELVEDVLAPVAESKGQSLRVHAEVEGLRKGPALALRDVVLSLGLRAALEGDGDEIELAAVEGEGDGVRFAVQTHRASDSSPSDGERRDRRTFEVFRIDRETGEFTISPEGLGVAAAMKILEGLGCELERNGVGPIGRLSFVVELPRS